MSTTTNWNLPQFEGDGYFNYSQLNGAFSTIDAALGPKNSSYKSNTNFIRNGDFRYLINRNGKVEYSGTTAVCFDCWKHDTVNAKSTIGNGYVRIGCATDLSTQTFLLVQKLSLPEIFIGRQVTVSVLVKEISSTNDITAGLRWGDASTGEYTGSPMMTLTNGLNTITYNFRLDASFDDLKFGFNVSTMTTSDYIDVEAVKIEFGPRQTLAYEDGNGNWIIADRPDLALQYALCSQYSLTTDELIGLQYSNPNLLDNAYWMNRDAIINQRDLNTYSGAGYTIDRWKNETSCGSLSVNTTRITFTWNRTAENEFAAFTQYIENNNVLCEMPYTFSILACGEGSLQLRGVDEDPHLSITLSETLTLYSFTIPSLHVDSSKLARFRLISDGSSSLTGHIDLYAAKLEYGTNQTLAHKEGDNWVLNDPPPNKTVELLKCLKYQMAINTGYAGLALTGITSNSMGSIVAYIILPITPRVQNAPTPALTAAYTQVYYNGQLYNVAEKSDTARFFSSTMEILLRANVDNSSEIPTGVPVTVMFNTTTEMPYLLYDANL